MSIENIDLPSEGAIKEAKNSPNGYIYVTDKQYANSENVPPENIKGPWQVASKMSQKTMKIIKEFTSSECSYDNASGKESTCTTKLKTM